MKHPLLLSFISVLAVASAFVAFDHDEVIELRKLFDYHCYGEDAAKDAIVSELESAAGPHAFYFLGPMGTCKTIMAKIISLFSKPKDAFTGSCFVELNTWGPNSDATATLNIIQQKLIQCSRPTIVLDEAHAIPGKMLGDLIKQLVHGKNINGEPTDPAIIIIASNIGFCRDFSACRDGVPPSIDPSGLIEKNAEAPSFKQLRTEALEYMKTYVKLRVPGDIIIGDFLEDSLVVFRGDLTPQDTEGVFSNILTRMACFYAQEDSPYSISWTSEWLRKMIERKAATRPTRSSARWLRNQVKGFGLYKVPYAEKNSFTYAHSYHLSINHYGVPEIQPYLMSLDHVQNEFERDNLKSIHRNISTLRSIALGSLMHNMYQGHDTAAAKLTEVRQSLEKSFQSKWFYHSVLIADHEKVSLTDSCTWYNVKCSAAQHIEIETFFLQGKCHPKSKTLGL